MHCIGDAHVYLNHVDALREQLTREPRPFPTLTIAPEVTDAPQCTSYPNPANPGPKLNPNPNQVTDALQCTFADLKIDGYTPHGKIAMKMAV